MRPAPADPGPDGRVHADVVVVGAGVAGLFTAISLPAGLDVVVVDKGHLSGSGSSPWAQGGMAVAVGQDDDPSLHAADTVRAGDGLCDERAVEVLTREAPSRLRDLLALGARFDRVDRLSEPDRPSRADASRDEADVGASRLHLAREGGQRRARSVHAADATGRELMRVLRDAAAPRVARLEGACSRVALTDDGAAGGVWVVVPGRGLVLVAAPATVLATGGCGGLFAATTNPDSATGDGVALAVEAGAAVRDVEFVQFHPTGLAVSGSLRFLLTEALRGAGATLHDADGRRFMADLHPDAELAPRHIVATGILRQEGGAWLDATALGEDRLAAEFPTVLAGARRHGFDLATERVPVTPAAHYMVGGVRTDLDGRTTLPGLHAVGETASTGVHGANRMAGNSLTEALVFGRRCADGIAATTPRRRAPPARPPRLDVPGEAEATALRTRLRALMWEGVGPVRDASGLRAAADGLAELGRAAVAATAPPDTTTDEVGAAPGAAGVEFALARTTAALIARAAATRTETRGGHVRVDHPATSPVWADAHLEWTRPPP